MLIFGAREDEILPALESKLGQPVHERTYYLLKKEIQEEEESADEWLDKFTRFGIPAFYKRRFDEVEYILRTLMIVYSQELNKDKKNVYAIDKLARTIGETSKILAEYGMAPPIIAKIKSMIPLEINQLNTKIENAATELKQNDTYLKSLDVIDNSNNTDDTTANNNGRDTKPETIPPRESVCRPKTKDTSIPTVNKTADYNGGANTETTTTEQDDDNAVF